MKTLVTGGAGFIGSALIWALNQRGLDDIIVSDFLGTDDRWKNLVPLRFADYIEADDLLRSLDSPRFSDIKTIYHLGACSATTEKDCRYLIQNNYEFTRRLAEWAIRGRRRFVYASSAATYGDGTAGMDDRSEDLHRFRPLNMYGYSKHLFDLHAQKMGWLDRIVGLKYFNVFGPNESHKGDMRSVVHKAFGQIRENGKVQLFKSEHPDFRDGEQMRDFFYVKDAVDATIHLGGHSEASGLFNLGSGVASTWIQLITPIFNQLGLPVNIEFIDLPDSLRGKYQYHTCADISRLKATAWFGPGFPLEAAVRDYVSDYLIPGRYLGDA
ncbi:MAG: ADP-glyceromanno-heptose 6-epimerase [Luteolibacter sp.]